MILLTALNDKEFYINCDLIEKIEVTPDTVITTTTNKKYVVKESPEDIMREIIQYRKSYMNGVPEVIR
jgi:flagellar protein FlbD